MISPVNRTPVITQRLIDENKVSVVTGLYQFLWSDELAELMRDSRYRQAKSEQGAADCHVGPSALQYL